MNFLFAVFSQAGRNLLQTWRTQILSLMTITLSVLIFSFFYLVYTNALQAGEQLGDDLRLIVYLDEEAAPALQEQYRDKILKFDRVEKINFISSLQAFNRFKEQLDEDQDVLSDIPQDFLPPSIEVYPVRSLDTLSRIKRFSDYLQTLPGVIKVQYGREWVERFYTFIELLRIVVILSGSLLILTTTFMMAHSIRLTLLTRQKELEILHLVGASSSYIRMPFFLEGALLGLFGSIAGMAALYMLFNWIELRFAGSAMLGMFSFNFFPLPVIAIIIGMAIVLCACGSFSSTRKILSR
ncbi:MAG: ABC transporter permease [Deltaproteobacteria bacterium]|nr:ABC transporter permease [Deltaproteobacteria bacterium]